MRDHRGARRLWAGTWPSSSAHWPPGRKGAPRYLEQSRSTPGPGRGSSRTACSLTVRGRAARLQPGDGRVLRPGEPGRGGRRGARPGGTRGSGSWGAAAVGRAPGVPQRRPGLGAQGRVGAVPLVPRGAAGGKSYRVTWTGPDGGMSPSRPFPMPVPAPGSGQAVGIDRGVAVSAALLPASCCTSPRLTAPERARLRRLQRNAPVPARHDPPRAGQMRDRPAAGPGACPAQRARPRRSRRHRAAVPCDGRRPLRVANAVGQGHAGEPGPERPGQGRAEPGDPGVGVGAAGAPAAGQGDGPGGEGQIRVDEPAVLGVRAGGPGLA